MQPLNASPGSLSSPRSPHPSETSVPLLSGRTLDRRCRFAMEAGVYMVWGRQRQRAGPCQRSRGTASAAGTLQLHWGRDHTNALSPAPGAWQSGSRCRGLHSALHAACWSRSWRRRNFGRGRRGPCRHSCKRRRAGALRLVHQGLSSWVSETRAAAPSDHNTKPSSQAQRLRCPMRGVPTRTSRFRCHYRGCCSEPASAGHCVDLPMLLR